MINESTEQVIFTQKGRTVMIQSSIMCCRFCSLKLSCSCTLGIALLFFIRHSWSVLWCSYLGILVNDWPYLHHLRSTCLHMCFRSISFCGSARSAAYSYWWLDPSCFLHSESECIQSSFLIKQWPHLHVSSEHADHWTRLGLKAGKQSELLIA